MEVFDLVLMVVGALLILTGVILFASGKRESANSSQVEGFGIKLNVSNPSIILIVLGIGLLLAPRLLPGDRGAEGEPAPGPVVDRAEYQAPATTTVDAPPPASEEITGTQQAEPNEVARRPEAVVAAVTPTPRQESATTPASNVFLPSGTWNLVDYEEDGMDFTDNLRGNISFQQQSPNVVGWTANYILADMWGNTANLMYQGTISSNNGLYFIQTTASNNPTFYDQGASPLIMKFDNGGLLHMEYNSEGSDILSHWSQ